MPANVIIRKEFKYMYMINASFISQIIYQKKQKIEYNEKHSLM